MNTTADENVSNKKFTCFISTNDEEVIRLKGINPKQRSYVLGEEDEKIEFYKGIEPQLKVLNKILEMWRKIIVNTGINYCVEQDNFLLQSSDILSIIKKTKGQFTLDMFEKRHPNTSELAEKYNYANEIFTKHANCSINKKIIEQMTFEAMEEYLKRGIILECNLTGSSIETWNRMNKAEQDNVDYFIDNNAETNNPIHIREDKIIEPSKIAKITVEEGKDALSIFENIFKNSKNTEQYKLLTKFFNYIKKRREATRAR